jgi:hypothetical protein
MGLAKNIKDQLKEDWSFRAVIINENADAVKQVNHAAIFAFYFSIKTNKIKIPMRRLNQSLHHKWTMFGQVQKIDAIHPCPHKKL